MHKSRIILKLLLISVIINLLGNLLIAQKSFTKNPHVDYNVSLTDNGFLIQYKFLDPFNNFQNYELVLPERPTLEMINKFGVPKWMFEPYVDTEANRWSREQKMAEGFFHLNDNTIEVNKSAVIAYYGPIYCKPIAEMIISSLSDYGLDTRRNRIEMAMRFIQDIPYGIPTYDDKNLHYGGVSPPPKLLIEGFGDCDSKVLLFVGILSYLIPAEDIIFLNQPEHVLSAIKAEPEKGLTYIRFKKETYLIAETAGPGKRFLGEKGNYFRNKFKVEELEIPATQPISVSPEGVAKNNRMQERTVGKYDLEINNTAKRNFNFQLSFDNQTWKQFKLEPSQTGKFNFDEQKEIFFRFREKRSNYKNYRIHSGTSYSIKYNAHQKSWELVL